jgi:hypothetical protein
MPVVVERGVLFRPFAAKMARRRLQCLYELPRGPGPDAAGYKGFFYHFLDIETGRRVWQCELSTVDSAFLCAGMLTAASYFDQDTADEAEVRWLADALYRRADWDWARDGGPTLTHGWRPEIGFLPYRWEGYEGLLLYVLGLGSPTHLLPRRATPPSARPTSGSGSTAGSCSTPGPCSPPAVAPVDRLPRPARRLHARPRQRLLREQPAGDLRAAGVRGGKPAAVRGLRGALLGVHRLRRPRLVQADGRRGRAAVLRLHRPRRPVRPDDGTVAPWVVLASLSFAPEIVLPTVRNLAGVKLGGPHQPYAFRCSFNQTFRVDDSPAGWWVTPHQFGIDQRPVVLMIENYRTGLIWDLVRRCRPVATGLQRAGFTDSWL